MTGAGETAPLWVASSLTSPVNRLHLGFSHRPPSTLFTTESANHSQLEVKHRHLEQWGLILSLRVPGPHIPTLTRLTRTCTLTHTRTRTHTPQSTEHTIFSPFPVDRFLHSEARLPRSQRCGTRVERRDIRPGGGCPSTIPRKRSLEKGFQFHSNSYAPE